MYGMAAGARRRFFNDSVKRFATSALPVGMLEREEGRSLSFHLLLSLFTSSYNLVWVYLPAVLVVSFSASETRRKRGKWRMESRSTRKRTSPDESCFSNVVDIRLLSPVLQQSDPANFALLIRTRFDGRKPTRPRTSYCTSWWLFPRSANAENSSRKWIPR